jgi:acetyltransferase-like isoleucine patch superfamily enzyme
MLKKLKKYLSYRLASLIKPEIIGGFTRADKVFLKHVGISNMSHVSYPENLDIEDYVFIGHFNYIDCLIGTRIGEGTQISNFISVLNHSSHLALRLHAKQQAIIKPEDRKGLTKGRVDIGKYCFIGAHSIIMPGTKLGDGCIVSAYSFVKGEFPPFSILRGSPAVVVGDARQIDEQMLAQFPELREHYMGGNFYP